MKISASLKLKCNSVSFWRMVSKRNTKKSGTVFFGKNLFIVRYPDDNLQAYSYESCSKKFDLNKNLESIFITRDYIIIREIGRRQINIYDNSGQLMLKFDQCIQKLSSIEPIASFCMNTLIWKQSLPSNSFEYNFCEVNVSTLTVHEFKTNKMFGNELRLISKIWGFDVDNVIGIVADKMTNQKFLCKISKSSQEIILKINLREPELPFKFYLNDERNLISVSLDYLSCINPKTRETIWDIPKPTIYGWAKGSNRELYIHNNEYYHLTRIDDFVVIDLKTGKTLHQVKNWRANYTYLEEEQNLQLQDTYELHNSFFTLTALRFLKATDGSSLVDAFDRPKFIPYLYLLDNRTTQLIYVMEFEETSKFRHQIHGDNLFVFTAGKEYEAMDMRVYQLDIEVDEHPVLSSYVD